MLLLISAKFNRTGEKGKLFYDLYEPINVSPQRGFGRGVGGDILWGLDQQEITIVI